MSIFRLFVNSSDGVDIDPEYDFNDGGNKIEDIHVTQDGSEYRYKWGSRDRIKFSVKYVDSSFMYTVNNWWSNNTEVKFMEVGITDTERNVRIINKDKPISKNVKPYRNLFEGVIELGTY